MLRAGASRHALEFQMRGRCGEVRTKTAASQRRSEHLKYPRISFPVMQQDDAITKLAGRIDAARRAERLLSDPDHVARLRREGACELHRVCADLVSAVNRRTSEALLDLSPPTYSAHDFRETGPNLFQISSQGRQMQIAFEAPPQLVSTEKFLMPYVLEGEVRTDNQAMLERFDVRSQMIFLCVQGENAAWRFFDWRTRATGPLSGETLVKLIEPLF